MKIKKSLLKAIALAVAVGSMTASCTKEDLTLGDNDKAQKKEQKVDNCPACGMG
jgi:hypothetical protein